MTKKEMLRYFKTLDYMAKPTIATMDMGIQYDYCDSEGAGTGFGGMGDWPAYCFTNTPLHKWNEIIAKVAANALTYDDLKGTGLDFLADDVSSFKEYTLSELFTGITELEGKIQDRVFVLFDTGMRYDPAYDKVKFFATQDDLEAAFQKAYGGKKTHWDDMSKDELEYWMAEIKDNEMDEFYMYEYDAQRGAWVER